MISKTGKNLGFQKNQPLVVKNLNWYVSSTQPITITNTTNLVLVTPS